jgi:hypothetical protein
VDPDFRVPQVHKPFRIKCVVAHDHCLAVNNPGDYTRIYLEDEYLEEMSDNARVWRVYNDEADRTDMERVDGWKGTLDTLLIFVSTTVD